MRAVEVAEEQWAAMVAEIEARKRDLAERLPDEAACLRAMGDAWQRLKELGWREAIYCPKDGTPFDAIEFGSTGIHDCHYEGEWPNGHWWIHEDGDLCPSQPVMFRERP